MKRTRLEANLSEEIIIQKKKRRLTTSNILQFLEGHAQIKIKSKKNKGKNLQFKVTIPMGLKAKIIYLRFKSLNSENNVYLKLHEISKLTGIRQSTISMILAKWRHDKHRLIDKRHLSGRKRSLSQDSRGSSCTIIAAINQNQGLVHYQIIEGSNNSKIFRGFIQNLMEKIEGEAYVIMDNLPIHKTNELHFKPYRKTMGEVQIRLEKSDVAKGERGDSGRG